MNSTSLGVILLLSLACTLAAQEPVDSIRLLAPQQPGPPITLRAIGDAENDGDDDLLSLGLDRIQIWFNDGSGEFSAGPVTLLPFPNNHFPDTVRFGDVTGDGLADMVVTDAGPALGLHIRLGLAGGTFGPVISLPTNFVVQDFDLGDGNGDGQLDIVELHGLSGAESLTWWYWNGVNFASSTPFVNTDVNTTLRSITAVDLDLDGADDIVVVESLGPNVITYMTVLGSPTLGVSAALNIPAATAYRVVGGDLDGDQVEDVVIARLFSSRIDIQPVMNLGTGGIAVGTAQTLNDYDVNTYSVPFHLGDWDGDGDAEILSEARTTSGGVSRPGFFVHENDGNNIFTRRAHIMSDTTLGGAGARDFNADGFLDFASTSGIKFGDGTFHDTLVRISPAAHRAVDWDGDGDLDLYGAGALGSIGVNDGTGTFTVATGLVPPLPGAPLEFYSSPSILGDFDGDGRLDYVVAKRQFTGTFTLQFVGMFLIVDNGLGGFEEAGLAAPAGVAIPGTGQSESELFILGAHDVDGDNDMDILTTSGYWPNDGSGFFMPFVSLFSGQPIAALDVDNDFDLDIIVYVGPPTFGAAAQINLLRHDGSLGYTTEPILSAPFLHVRAGLVDLDEDGDTDLTIGTAPQENQLFLFENAGGSFLPGPILTVDFGKGSAVFVEDFDGDGLGDLATGTSEYGTSQSEQTFYIFPRTSTGITYGTPRGYIGRSLQGGADVDNDGDLDPIGAVVIRNWKLNGPDVGGIRQYGAGIAGSGEAVPVLGASGPLRPGSTNAALHLRRGLGGAPGLLAIGLEQAQLIDVPFPGFTIWINPIILQQPLVLSGLPGAPGAGTFDLPLGGALSVLAGIPLYAQIVIVDPAGVGGVTSSGGLELSFGL